MFSKKPIDMSAVSKADNDRQILRAALMAELDAINLYEQMAANSDDALNKAVLLEIAGDEKRHVAQFTDLLMKADPEHAENDDEGVEENGEIEDALK